ncbi:hypothetical protein GQ43DRAFT_195605 [Delitschia confertaspora ATCC 74209]|uniref:Uncharacterized protein n=1 Tax=Delitschia confertaspora ATCC 74209 TaxID=1513339 RepID=A0A9P4JJ62_9PLEO|nr:hypothetical protein GQ43DRAFT_195605 [Delitschia confertaspora ATCC 74209]
MQSFYCFFSGWLEFCVRRRRGRRRRIIIIINFPMKGDGRGASVPQPIARFQPVSTERKYSWLSQPLSTVFTLRLVPNPFPQYKVFRLFSLYAQKSISIRVPVTICICCLRSRGRGGRWEKTMVENHIVHSSQPLSHMLRTCIDVVLQPAAGHYSELAELGLHVASKFVSSV